MNIAYIEEQSYIYGPGCRFVIWVQGCSLHCEGCWNAEMWSFQKRHDYSISDLTTKIVSLGNKIEGITILGGEPLDQLSDVHELCQIVQNTGLSTMVFTGYEDYEIDNSAKQIIKSVTDILITGRYIESKRTTNHQWIGSTNQHIHFLTDRYREYTVKNANYLEININDNGRMEILGFPTENIQSIIGNIAIDSP